MDSMQELLHSMCRLCLKRIGHHALFLKPKLVCAVAKCSGVRLKPDAAFPHTVCDKCLKQIHICKAFRKMVAKTERKLHQLKADLGSGEFIKNTKFTTITEFEGPKQKKKTKHKSAQTSNTLESYSVLESEDAATQKIMCAYIVPRKKLKMEWSYQDLEESSDQSSNSCHKKEERKYFFKKNLSKKRKKNNHILAPKSVFMENLAECMKPKDSEESFHMVLKNAPQHTISEEGDQLSTQEDKEIEISKCSRKKIHRSIHDFSEENLSGYIIHENAPDGKSISVVESSLDICHEDKSSKKRNKCEFIPELLSEKNPCVNIEHESQCIARNIRLDLEEVKQKICEKPNKQRDEYKQKSIQENDNTGELGILFGKKEYQYITEANKLQTSAVKPELVIEADNCHSIKTDMITSNSEVSEVKETLMMYSESRRQKMVNCNNTCTEDELECNIKTRSRINRLNDLGGAFKVKIGVSPRLKQKFSRKCVEQILNANDSILEIHKRATPAAIPIYDEGQSHIEVNIKDRICFHESQSININHKQNSLDSHTRINISNHNNNEEQDLAENIKKTVQAETVPSQNLNKSLLNGVSKCEDDFIIETPLPKKIRLQRKVKQEKKYTEPKVYTESEFSILSDSNDSDYEVHLNKKIIKKNIMRSNITDYTVKKIKHSKENSTISPHKTSVFETNLDISDLGEQKTKKVYNSKELVCKKCKPLKIFTSHKEYKFHTYLHMRINRFC